MKTAWINGRFDASISPHDEGFLLGHGVFETIGVFDGNLPLWAAHMRRLGQGAAVLGIPFDPPANLPGQALALLDRQPGDDILRVTLSAGVDGHPTWCMTTRQRETRVGPVLLHVPKAGVQAGPMATIKTTSRAALTMLRREAQAAGCDDALLVAADDRVLETTSGNLFFRRHGELQTPRLDGSVLPGVGRAALLASLEHMGVNVAQSAYTLADLGECEELFVTNAVYGPQPAQFSIVDARPLDPIVAAAWQRAIRQTAPRRDRPAAPRRDRPAQ